MTEVSEALAGRPASEERGEIILKLDGGEMVLRPSYEAIEAFERSTGKGLLQLARDSLSATMTLAEAAQIACECIRAWGRATDQKAYAAVSAPRVAELMLESEGGFRQALATISGMLAMANTGGYTAKGEIKPTTMQTSGALVAG